MKKLLMLHVWSIFVWIVIKIEWLPLIFKGKSTGKVLVCFSGVKIGALTREINFFRLTL